MRFELDANPNALSIAAYAPGWIRIGDRRIESPCVVTSSAVHEDMLPPSIEALAPSHLRAIADLNADIVILGTGERQHLVAHGFVGELAAAGVGLEIMDTGAACRSFNILTAEGRAVAAALFMI